MTVDATGSSAHDGRHRQGTSGLTATANQLDNRSPPRSDSDWKGILNEMDRRLTAQSCQISDLTRMLASISAQAADPLSSTLVPASNSSDATQRPKQDNPGPSGKAAGSKYQATANNSKMSAVMLDLFQPFTGLSREPVNMWLAQLADLMDASGYSPKERKAILMTLLGEKPRAHLMATLFRGLNESQYEQVSYEQIRHELLKEYGSAMVTASVNAALQERTQRVGESDADYIEDLVQMFALAYPTVPESVVVDMLLSKFRRTALDPNVVYATKLMFSDERYLLKPPTLQEVKLRISAVSDSASSVNRRHTSAITPVSQAPWRLGPSTG